MDCFKVYIVHKYGVCLNKYPESVQICVFAKQDI